jgi:hypothetical protein
MQYKSLISIIIIIKNGNVEDENREKDSQEIADVEFDDIYPVFLST